MKNKYLKHTHISERKFREITKLFCIDETASKTSLITSIHVNTIERIFMCPTL